LIEHGKSDGSEAANGGYESGALLRVYNTPVRRDRRNCKKEGNKMKNLSKLLCITALAAVIGFVLISCQDPIGGYPIPHGLIGTWTGTISGNDTTLVFTEHSLKLTSNVDEDLMHNDGYTLLEKEGTTMTFGARSAGDGRKRIDIELSTLIWVTFCKSYVIDGSKCTFKGLFNFQDADEIFTKQ